MAAGKTPPGNWMRAFGCDEALLAGRRGPTRAELDAAVPRNPLRLRHQTLHASWLNSRAIAALGLEAPDFKAPEGAVLMRDATGRLSGLVAGMESYLSRRLPLVTPAELESRARLFSRELAAAGVTAFTDATVRNGPEEVALMARLLSGRAVTQRIAMMLGRALLQRGRRGGADRASGRDHAGRGEIHREPREPTIARSRDGSRARVRQDSTRRSIAPRSKTSNSRSTRSRPPRAGCRPRATAARSFVSSMAA